MAIDFVKIPQNVYIEDRIVGPLTLKQLMVIGIGGGVSYVIFSALQKAMGGHMPIPLTILAWTPCAIAAMFALVKVNDLTLARICLLLIEKAMQSPVRTWTPREGISVNIHFRVQNQDREDKKQAAAKSKAEQKTEDKIRQLSTILDRPALLDDTEQESEEAIAEERHEEALRPASQPSSDTSATEKSADDALPFPVNPNKISVDGQKAADLPSPKLSNLSVFRDLLPPTT